MLNSRDLLTAILMLALCVPAISPIAASEPAPAPFFADSEDACEQTSQSLASQTAEESARASVSPFSFDGYVQFQFLGSGTCPTCPTCCDELDSCLQQLGCPAPGCSACFVQYRACDVECNCQKNPDTCPVI